LCSRPVTVSGPSGVVVSVLTTGPKGRGFEPDQGNGFLIAIKIRRTLSFGWEIKPEVPCRNILRHVKDLLKTHGDEETKFSFPSTTLLPSSAVESSCDERYFLICD
jgi:hypothetical protein